MINKQQKVYTTTNPNGYYNTNPVFSEILLSQPKPTHTTLLDITNQHQDNTQVIVHRTKHNLLYNTVTTTILSKSRIRGSDWFIREVSEMFGIQSEIPDTRNLLLEYNQLPGVLKKTFPVSGTTEILFDFFSNRVKHTTAVIIEL